MGNNLSNFIQFGNNPWIRPTSHDANVIPLCLISLHQLLPYHFQHGYDQQVTRIHDVSIKALAHVVYKQITLGECIELSPRPRAWVNLWQIVACILTYMLQFIHFIMEFSFSVCYNRSPLLVLQCKIMMTYVSIVRIQMPHTKSLVIPGKHLIKRWLQPLHSVRIIYNTWLPFDENNKK
jgi:hypothetical protein